MPHPASPSSSRGRARKPSEKQAIINKEKDKDKQKKKSAPRSTKKSSRKRRKGASADDSTSESSSSDEDDVPRKRHRKEPASEIVEIGGSESEEDAEMVELDDRGASDEDECGAKDIGPEAEVNVASTQIELDSDDEVNDGLKDRHRAPLADSIKTKADSTKDLLLVFSDRKTVVFHRGNGQKQELKGRWCNICRKNAADDSSKLRKSFHVGSNSSCRQHIRQHYKFYSQQCKEKNIEEAEHAVPREILRARQEAASKNQKALVQRKLEGFGVVSKAPKEFTREGILKAVTLHITSDDQAFDLAAKASFRNCLVTMRPQSTKNDLPSPHDVKVYLHNEFIRHLNDLGKEVKNIPGKASITCDGWTADTTSFGFIGLTMHWIHVGSEGEWALKSAVIGMRGLSGNHSGKNLGRYVAGLCDRVELLGKEHSKLGGATLDNTSSNTYICKAIAKVHKRRKLEAWDYKENQFMCLGHVVNLANIDVMGHITNIAAVENKTAIWEFDPALPRNRVANGGLDVIAALRTLAIKIQASGVRIEHFNELQVQCGIGKPLKIPLHSNVRWGTAYGMLDRAYQLRQPIGLFVAAADARYGPITTIRREGQPPKDIPWTAFTFSEADWQRVLDARDILADSNRIQQAFSSENQATLWRSLPLMEDLQTKWEKKRDGSKGYERFAIYKPAIQDGLNKLRKYYCKFDEKPAYVLALMLHPYYKLDYIGVAWGGEQEQQKERENGNPDAKNWKEEALKIFEATAERYWQNRPESGTAPRTPLDPTTGSSSITDDSIASDFDRHRQAMLTQNTATNATDGWSAEVRRYLKSFEVDVSKDTNIVTWWQNHAKVYPTLARMALDILPIQASSVPCERLFSSSKQVATDRRARLGSDRFEQLLIMKSAWRGTIADWAGLNSDVVEEVELREYEELLQADVDARGWAEKDDVHLFESESEDESFA